ncbi:IctB family putative bicarbonate transporter [Gloeobacter morelensis]|uniref:Bicarbonate transporter, IctB family n=1 Tax=Gloeobacter morelensis MG652769 TaxID=2781736 RepID=A0ABY3PRF1_9CYAN|nr:IctB family putative bicarbonate transporter [Gloeobacter morelensis]UFP96007.1 putative bicarbonate transporter, IctB family [Gloeobacter morelensis MG652769]
MAILQRWASSSFAWGFLESLAFADAPLQRWWRASLPGRVQQWLSHWAAGSLAARAAEPVAAGVFCLVLLISPFVPTAAVGAVLAVGLALVVLLFAARTRPLSPLALPVLAFWLSGWVSLIGSPRVLLSLDGWLKMTLYAGGFALGAHLLQKPLYRTLAVGSYLAATLPVSIYGLLQYVNGAPPLATWVDPESPLADTTRVYSFLGNPNLLAAYLIAAIPLGVVGALVWKNWAAKVMAALAAGAGALCLVLTYSRGGWIALMATVLVLAVLLWPWLGERLKPEWRLWVPVVFLGTAAAALVVAVVAVPAVGERALSIFDGRDDSSNNFRITVWGAVFEMIRAYPLTGIGPGNLTFEAIYPFFQRPKFDALSAYSIVLEITVELGIVGLLAFLWLASALLVQGFTVWVRRAELTGALWCAAATCAVVGLLVNGLSDTVWFRPSVQVVWWMLCALIGAEYLRAHGQVDQD